MNFADMHMNHTVKLSRIDNSHMLKSYLKFLKYIKKKKLKEQEKNFLKYEDK